MWKFAVLGLALCGVSSAQVFLKGKVTNENNSPVAGARVTLAHSGRPAVEAIADPSGEFTFRLPDSGEYRIAAEREGYFRMTERPVTLNGGNGEIRLTLNAAREIFETVDVSAVSTAIDLETTTASQSLAGAQILSIPFPSSNNLKNAMRIMPGVVQDDRGGIHLNGGTEEQILVTLNGFTLNDPLTGRFESRLGVESIQSVDVTGSRLPAEFGKGASGMLALNTMPGDDKIRYSVTNFFPGIENRKGILIGNWSPRLNLSGPIRKGRAWFSDSIATQYDQQVIDELPKSADRMQAWRLSNVLYGQVNLTPANILFAGFLVNGWWAPKTGLGILSPPETTVDRRSRQWFVSVKDQIFYARGAYIEFGFAANRTYGREIPQGPGVLVMTPFGNRGNSYTDAIRRAGRDQWLANALLPSFTALGSHQLRAGIDIDRLTFAQQVHRSGLEQTRVDGSLIRRVSFTGPTNLFISNIEAATYVQDTWRVRRGLVFEGGLRQDWDRTFAKLNLAPRVGFAWAPFASRKAKFAGGYGLVYETTNLRTASRPLDQSSLITYFTPEGGIARGPAVTVFVPPMQRPSTPRAQTANIGYEQELPWSMNLRTGYTRRRLERGITYSNILQNNAPPPTGLAATYGTGVFDAVYAMSNLRRDVYDSVEVTVRQTLRKQYGWMASYTRSRALSNNVVDISIDDPVVILNNVGPMPWDAPNRFVGWGYMPLPRTKWAVACLADQRTGFPYSVQSDGAVVGGVNTHRFPAFFEMNLHLERRFTFKKHRWEFRGGANNFTNHRNPNVVNSIVESPEFGHMYGGQSRALNFRLRWLGKATQ